VSPGASIDPDLAILDQPGASPRRRPEPHVTPEEFDLTTVDTSGLPVGERPETDETDTPRARRRRGSGVTRFRQQRARKREIMGAIAVTAVAMMLVVLLALAGSCAG
jgi:hypothetical protein